MYLDHTFARKTFAQRKFSQNVKSPSVRCNVKPQMQRTSFPRAIHAGQSAASFPSAEKCCPRFSTSGNVSQLWETIFANDR